MSNPVQTADMTSSRHLSVFLCFSLFTVSTQSVKVSKAAFDLTVKRRIDGRNFHYLSTGMKVCHLPAFCTEKMIMGRDVTVKMIHAVRKP